MAGVQKRKIRWTISLLVAVCFVSFPAQAQYGGGTGEPNDPYMIYSAEQMNEIGLYEEDWDKNFILMADIDLSAYTGTDFNIIGKWFNTFTGVFNGNGHKISNFSYTSTDRNNIGLFKYVGGENALIKDLGLINPNVDMGTEGGGIGSLVGSLSEGTITGCYVEGGSVSGNAYVGGLVGSNGGAISNCYSSGRIAGASSVGGLVGENSLSYPLGIGNREPGTITNCFSAGDVSGITNVGGLVGSNSEGTITNCYSSGDVSGDDSIGGLLGMNGGAITYCYSVGSITGTTDVGGLIGTRSEYGERRAMYSFWDIQTSGQASSAGGTGKTTAEMQMVSTFTDAGWDFAPHDVWVEPVGVGYPILWWQLSPLPTLPTFSGGAGTAYDPYLISTGGELNSIGHNPRLTTAHFKLIKDIDLTGVDFFVIGSELFPFTGVFDGNGHTISNFTYTSADTDYIGLFGYISGENVRIKDLGLIDPNVDAGTGDYVGSLVGQVGYLTGGTITHCYVEGGSVSGHNNVGGLVGHIWEGTISNCYSNAQVSGDSRVGGLVGGNYYRCTITNCYTTGSVLGDSRVGGLVGSNGGTITNCYSTGSVSGTTDVGGLVGEIRWDGTITNCYSVGAVTGTTDVGGLVGLDDGREVYNSYSFWDIQTSGQASSDGGTGKTTAEMQMENTFIGWECGYVWTIDEGNDYPRLWWENKPGVALDTQLSDLITGVGMQIDPYLIYTAEELNMIGRFLCDWDKHFKLMDDIDLTGIDFFVIGSKAFPFTGVFDGNGHKISNFSYTSTYTDYIGLFGCVTEGAHIKDLGLIDPNVDAGTGDLVGSLVGCLREGTIFNCYADSGSVSGDDYVGGLVGYNGGTITNCYSAGSVMGDDNVGGLVGINYGTVTNSYATSSVVGIEHVGGLVGWGNSTRVHNSFWDIETSGQSSSDGGTGKTTAEMQTVSTFLNVGWDFVDETVNGTEDIWWILEGKDYPKLWWQYGLAFSPYPQDGASDVIQSVILNWLPGGSGLYHDVYFGEDEEAVANATTESPDIYFGRQAAELTTYDMGTLEWDNTYYWRIDEVDEDDPNSPWKGDVWSFTTANFLIIDDFEYYNDIPGGDPSSPGGGPRSNRIYIAWVPAGYDDPVGFPIVHFPLYEETIVHGGNWSMPFYYDNAVRKSEATLTLTSNRDWTIEGVGVLSLWFYGDPNNAAEPMYVVLNGSAVVYHDNPNATQIETWTEWRIDLQAFADQGVNLTNVNSITIGFGDKNNPVAGGSGVVLFDDIRLYRPTPQETEP